MLRTVVEARGTVAVILAALTGAWGTHTYRVLADDVFFGMRRGGAECVPSAGLRLRHPVVRHAVLRGVAVALLGGDGRLSTRPDH